MFLKQRAEHALAELTQQSLYRTVSVAASPEVLTFASNDYLGLSRDRRLIEVGIRALEKHGVGGRSSTVVQGYSDAHAKLEAFICQLTGRDGVILFPNAFTANQAVFDALMDAEDRLYVHRDNHASLNHSLRSGQYHFKRFRETPDIKTDRSAWLISDHIFSVTGARAPIDAYVHHAAKPALFIDDIHGLGVYGDTGLSLAEQYTQQQLPLISWGFGKALGAYGGALLGDGDLIELVRQRARSYIYSTALPAHVVEIAAAALEIMHAEPAHRCKLQQNMQYMQAQSKAMQIEFEQHELSPIFCYWMNSVQEAVRLQGWLESRALSAALMRWPTVPQNTACLRFVIRADHSEGDIDRLLYELKQFRDC